MLNISSANNSLIIESDNQLTFPYQNGKISVPYNSITYVIDESDFIAFRSVSNNDIIFSANINDIRINGSSVTKDTFIEQFDIVANKSESASDATAGVNSINGIQGDVTLKTINGNDIVGSGDITIENVDLSLYATMSWVDEQGYAKSSEIPSLPSQVVTSIQSVDLYYEDDGYLVLRIQYDTNVAPTLTRTVIIGWKGTQAQYDALGTYYDTVTYNIIEG